MITSEASPQTDDAWTRGEQSEEGHPRCSILSALVRRGPGMPGPYGIRRPAFVGAGHALPAPHKSHSFKCNLTVKILVVQGI